MFLQKIGIFLSIACGSCYAHASLVDCIISAANEYDLPANDLLAIASIENGRNGAVSRNKNGSVDMGVFQLNSVHWEEKGQFRGKVSLERALNDGCYAAKIAAYIVKNNYTKYPKKDRWEVLSYYNSKNPPANLAYQKKLKRYSGAWASWLIKNYPNHQIVY